MSDDVDWSLMDFTDPRKDAGGEKSPPVSIKTCPKCGKPLGQGGHFHVKYCKGAGGDS